MTRRRTFPDAGSRLVYSITSGAFRGSAATQLKVYTNPGVTSLANIQTTLGVAISGSLLTVSSTSQVPLFLGPDDGTDTLYLRKADGTGPVTPIYARTDDRIDVTVNEGPRNPMSAEWGGATGDGTANDAAAFTTLLASFGTRGGEIELPPRLFRVPAGISEAVPGLVVRGQGHRHLNTGTTATSTGTVIQTDNTGAWCWTHRNTSGGSSNDYKGPRFEGITFAGDPDTGGGLRVLACSASVKDCTATGHTTGKGFWVDPDALGSVAADDASWASLLSCVAQNCLTGFHINAGAELVGCFTLKTTAGGIVDTGTGFLLQGGNISVLGGKAEGEGVGWSVTSTDGVFILGAKAENNLKGFYLNRPALPGFGSRHRLVGCHASATNGTSFEVGPNQQNDMLVGCSMGSAVVDNGANTVVLGDEQSLFTIRSARLLPMTAPAAPATGATLYVDSADGQVKVRKAGGAVVVIG